MLTKDEYQQVLYEVTEHLSHEDSMRGAMQAWFPINSLIVLRELPTNLSRTADQAAWLLSYCVQSRWAQAPSLLEEMLARLVSIAGRGSLAPLRNRVELGIDPNPSPFQTQWVLNRQPFFARLQLRESLKDLVTTNLRPILQVNGPKGSGKSYTAQLLDFIADQGAGDVHVATAMLGEGAAPSYEAVELAETLTTQMLADDRTPDRSTSSYPATLCRWIVRSAMRKPGVWLLVLDGFGQPDIQADVLELIQNLARMVTVPEVRRRVRLVLLHAAPAMLEGQHGMWTMVDDLHAPVPVTASDLVPCLRELNSLRVKEGRPWEQIDPVGIPAVADDILAHAPADPCQRLQTINSILASLAQMGGPR